MKRTTNLQLNKPDSEDFADIEVLNENADKIDAAINGKAGLSSPAFTGTPTAPTPPNTDKSTRLATTAFVKSQQLYHSGFVRTTDWGDLMGVPPYGYRAEISMPGVKRSDFATVAVHHVDLPVAQKAKMTGGETDTNKIVLYSVNKPTADIYVQIKVDRR